MHLASTQVFDRHSTFQGRPPTLRKVFTSVPQQPFNFRWNLSTANGGLREIRMLLADPFETLATGSNRESKLVQ